MGRSRARRLLYLAADAGVSLLGYRSRRAAFLKYERTLIRDARMGQMVKIVGRLRGSGLEFRAPLTAAACLWYRTTVKSIDVGGFVPLAAFWFGRRIQEEESQDLLVEDESGLVVVRRGCARFSLVEMRSGWILERTALPGGETARWFLERYAVTVAGAIAYREVVLKEGAEVAVLGRPRIELDPAGRGGFRTPATRTVFDEQGEIIVSNEPGVF